MAADNVVANSIPVATRSVTYSGDASQNAQVVGAVLLTGSDDAKVATDAIPATAGLDSTGGGIPAVALVAQFDDASTTTVTENQFAHPRLSSRRALLVEGVASGTALPVSAASLPLPSGAATETTLGGVLTTSDFDTKAGSLTESAPASDTASSGLNGRLQRIAQRLTSLIALLPTALGANGGLKVEPIPATAETGSNVASSATSVQLLASNSSRRAASIFNDSTAILYVKFGTTASATDHKVQVSAGGYYEFPLPIYQGRVDGIWASANGSARLGETT